MYTKTAADARFLGLAGGTMTGDVSLGDNVKAKFGASNDLQIYSDGMSSHIVESGTGNLNIRGDDLAFTNSAANKTYLNVDAASGSVYIRHGGSTKLVTTATGIDVTGSVTCDGFTSTGIDDNATSTAITIDASENVGVGRTSPSHKLDVLGDVRISSVINDATNKTSRIKFGHYTNAEEPVTGMFCNSFATTSTLNIGGGSSIENAQTDINFRTAANNTTVGGTLRLAINSTGNVEVNTGNLVIGTSGKGIDFSAATPDGTGSTGSEVLDDYEEGTFTPNITAYSGTNPTVTGVLSGTYTKVGNLVTVYVFGSGTTVSGTVSGMLVFGNLPFNPSTDSCGSFTSSVLNFARPAHYAISKLKDYGVGILSSNDGGSWAWETVNIIGASSGFRFSITYHT